MCSINSLLVSPGVGAPAQHMSRRQANRRGNKIRLDTHAENRNPDAAVQSSDSFRAQDCSQRADRAVCRADCAYSGGLALDLELGFDRVDRMAWDAC